MARPIAHTASHHSVHPSVPAPSFEVRSSCPPHIHTPRPPHIHPPTPPPHGYMAYTSMASTPMVYTCMASWPTAYTLMAYTLT